MTKKNLFHLCQRPKHIFLCCRRVRVRKFLYRSMYVPLFWLPHLLKDIFFLVQKNVVADFKIQIKPWTEIITRYGNLVGRPCASNKSRPSAENKRWNFTPYSYSHLSHRRHSRSHSPSSSFARWVLSPTRCLRCLHRHGRHLSLFCVRLYHST